MPVIDSIYMCAVNVYMCECVMCKTAHCPKSEGLLKRRTGLRGTGVSYLIVVYGKKGIV